VIAAGCDDFLRKPYRFSDIFDCMARHLGLKYIHGLSTAGSEDSAVKTIFLEGLADLPAEMRTNLGTALLSLHADSISTVINQVKSKNATLGVVLEHLTRKLAYSSILQAVER
jgi:hypothetical protein